MANLTKISFPVNGFWIHVDMNGSTGTDQLGDRWFLRNGKLYSEFSSRIIPLERCELPQPKKTFSVSADEMFMQQRESDRAVSFSKYRQHEIILRSYSADKSTRRTA